MGSCSFSPRVSPVPLEVTLHTPRAVDDPGKDRVGRAARDVDPGEPVAHGFRFGWLGGSAALAVALSCSG
jgi:hypothetical protein